MQLWALNKLGVISNVKLPRLERRPAPVVADAVPVEVAPELVAGD
jgi:hypothetical protein